MVMKMNSCLGENYIERMTKAMATPRFTMPHGLSIEEMRQHILDCANGKIEPDVEQSNERD